MCCLKRIVKIGNIKLDFDICFNKEMPNIFIWNMFPISIDCFEIRPFVSNDVSLIWMCNFCVQSILTSPINFSSHNCFQTTYHQKNHKIIFTKKSWNKKDHNMEISAITILGRDVTIPDEVIIRNSIVLPGKELTWGLNNQILL